MGVGRTALLWRLFRDERIGPRGRKPATVSRSLGYGKDFVSHGFRDLKREVPQTAESQLSRESRRRSQNGRRRVLVIKDDVGQELQDAGGVDVILSFSPSMKQNSQSISGLRPDGRFVTTAVSGDPIEADPVSMLFKQTSIIGSAHSNPGDIVDILNLVANGRVKP